MDALVTSVVLVAIAEIGDKTQLLSFALAARFRRPGPIILGILVATLANHALAASLGVWLASLVTADTLRWITGLAFIGFGVWALVPDRLDAQTESPRHGVFITTLVAFFVAEMGDKTQLATIALGARFAAPFAVITGTTLGMMLANVPAVWIGERLAGHLNLRAMRIVAALLFFATGLLTLFSTPD